MTAMFRVVNLRTLKLSRKTNPFLPVMYNVANQSTQTLFHMPTPILMLRAGA